MNFVYVLISSEKDYYLEQLFISSYSLKLHNPDATVTLMTDADTVHSFTAKRKELLKYIDRIITAETPAHFNAKEKSRYLKTSIPTYVSGDCAYIDTDTIVRGSLAELFASDIKMGAVLDWHIPFNNKNLQFIKCIKITKNSCPTPQVYLNGGFIYIKDCEETKTFFSDWHSLWMQHNERYGLQVDQYSFNITNYNHNNFIREIDGVYNCQIACQSSAKYIFNSKIFHYFIEMKRFNFFPLHDKNILSMVRKEGINDKIKEIIEDPVNIFLNYNFVLDGEELKIYNSPVSVFANKLSRDYPWTNKIAKAIYKLFGYSV